MSPGPRPASRVLHFQRTSRTGAAEHPNEGRDTRKGKEDCRSDTRPGEKAGEDPSENPRGEDLNSEGSPSLSREEEEEEEREGKRGKGKKKTKHRGEKP